MGPIKTLTGIAKTASTFPLWVWVSIGIAVIAIASYDDRRGLAESTWDVVENLPRHIQIMLGFAGIGFVVGWIYPPANMLAILEGFVGV